MKHHSRHMFTEGRSTVRHSFLEITDHICSHGLRFSPSFLANVRLELLNGVRLMSVDQSMVEPRGILGSDGQLAHPIKWQSAANSTNI
jgi:hypothetical protein